MISTHPSSMLHRLLDGLMRVWPIAVAADETLDRDLKFVDTELTSRELRTASVAVMTLTIPLAGAATLFGRPLVAAALAGGGAILGYAIIRLPRWFATVARTRATGAAPDLIAFAVLRAKIQPTPEATARFAAGHAHGPLADSLERQRRRTMGRSEQAWETFAATWSGWIPGLSRATSLLVAATQVDEDRRSALLDRALATVLTQTQDRATEFAASLRGPVSGLYAFGVVVPLALVATIPALGHLGGSMLHVLLVVCYDLVLPAGLLVAAGWVLARRPVAFRPTPVSARHPSVSDRHRLIAFCAGAMTAGASWILLPWIAPPWTRFVASPAIGVGIGAVLWFRNRRAIRQRVNDFERALPGAIALAGSHLQRGQPTEAAIAAVGDDLSGPAGTVFANTDRILRRTGVPPRRAFFGRHGTLRTFPSPRSQAALELFLAAGQEGAVGAKTLADLAEHLDALAAVERDCRTELATMVGTLRSTAWCFGPLIGGVTVAMARRIGSYSPSGFAGPGGSMGVSVAPPVGIAVGFYVLFLAAILAALACGLERGLDRTRVGHQVGLGLVAAGTIYPLAISVTRLLL